MPIEYSFTDNYGTPHEQAFCRINAVEIRREYGDGTAKIVADVFHNEASQKSAKPAIKTLYAEIKFVENFSLTDGYIALREQNDELKNGYIV